MEMCNTSVNLWYLICADILSSSRTLIMSIIDRWEALVQESGGALPSQLKQFQLDTQSLLESGRHALVAARTGAGKSLIMLNGARVIGGTN